MAFPHESIVYGFHAVEAVLLQTPQQLRRLLIDPQRHDPRIENIKKLAKNRGFTRKLRIVVSLIAGRMAVPTKDC